MIFLALPSAGHWVDKQPSQAAPCLSFPLMPRGKNCCTPSAADGPATTRTQWWSKPRWGAGSSLLFLRDSPWFCSPLTDAQRDIREGLEASAKNGEEQWMKTRAWQQCLCLAPCWKDTSSTRQIKGLPQSCGRCH